MSDLPKALREQLASGFQLWSASIASHKQADDGTEKLLVQLADGGRVECVLLRDGHVAPFVSVARWAARWDACFAPADWMASSGV